MFAALATLLIAWVVLTTAISGVGLVVSRALPGTQVDSLSRTFWLGWAGTIALLQVWCLFLPVDARAIALIGVVSAGGWLLCARERLSWARRARLDAVWMAPAAVAALWLADRALQAPQNGDSYLYHLPAVQWAERFAAVPGLGNLHGRLAFNNSSTLYLALLDHGPFAHGCFHVAHGLLVLPLFARGLRSLAGLLRGRTVTARDALDAVLLAAAVDLTLGPNLSSASPDLPAYVLEAVLASELTGWMDAGAPASAAGAFWLLALTLITIKLSAVGFALGVALVVLLRRPRLSWTPVFAALALLGPWMARGIILSGYPGYPSTVGALPFGWRIPTAAAINEANIVRAWGRRPGVPWQQVLSNHDWIGHWFQSIWLLNREVLVPFVLGVLALCVGVIRRPRSALWLLLLPPAGELVWWFLTAPDPRFAGASFWLLPAVGAALLIESSGRQGARALGLIAATLMLWPVAEAPSRAWVVTNGFVSPPQARVHPFRTRSGLFVAVPDGRSGCWGAPLLCSPLPRETLRMRQAGALGRGFKVGQ